MITHRGFRVSQKAIRIAELRLDRAEQPAKPVEDR